MPSRNTKDDRRMSKHLPVSSKCLAIVLSATKTHTDETVKIPTTVHNGKDLLEDFKLINKTCYWNPALVASIRSLTYKGYVEPTTILVVGNEIHLENLRTAWGRRVLKAPAGFTIELIGDVDSIEMQVIPQTQFIPLPDALCLITMDLNNRCIVATLDTIKEKLFEWYKEMTMPSDKLIFDTLGCLIQERKVFHSGNGYFVVTPDTYCIQTDYHNISYNKSWLPYHSMYIPVFPQMEGLKPNHQHQQHFYKHHMHDPMHLVHCPANVNDEVKPVCEVCKSENKAEVKQRPRSNSVRVSKTVEKDKDWCKEAITGTEETLKRSVSLRYKTDKVKSVKDINLKDSNINKDKEKGDKEKISFFSKIFGRNKKKKLPMPKSAQSSKGVEYASFSGQFPPPEWNWYKQQVEKQRRTEEWVNNQGHNVKKFSTSQYLQNWAPQSNVYVQNHLSEVHVFDRKAKPNKKDSVSHSHKTNEKRKSGRKHGGKYNRDKTNTREQKIPEESLLWETPYNAPQDLPSPFLVSYEQLYQSVVENNGMEPVHSTPCYNETFTKDSKKQEDGFPSAKHLEPALPYPHQMSLIPKYRSQPFHGCNDHSDINFEFKGKMPPKNSSCIQSRDSGVNCIGLSRNNESNKRYNCSVDVHPLVVSNQLGSNIKAGPSVMTTHDNLNTTMVSDTHIDLASPTVYNNNCHTSVSEHTQTMQIACQDKINYFSSKAFENSDSQMGPCMQDVDEQGYRTIPNNGEEKCVPQDPEIAFSDFDTKLVDSGFSSPRNVEGKDSKSKSLSRHCLKTQAPGFHLSPVEKMQLPEANCHKNIVVSSAQRWYLTDMPQGKKYSSQSEAHEMFKKHLSGESLCVKEEYEVFGVI